MVRGIRFSCLCSKSEEYQVSATVQALVQQLDEKTKEFDQEYNLSELSQNTFDNIGKKVRLTDALLLT